MLTRFTLLHLPGFTFTKDEVLYSGFSHMNHLMVEALYSYSWFLSNLRRRLNDLEYPTTTVLNSLSMQLQAVRGEVPSINARSFVTTCKHLAERNRMSNIRVVQKRFADMAAFVARRCEQSGMFVAGWRPVDLQWLRTASNHEASIPVYKPSPRPRPKMRLSDELDW